MSSSTIEQTTAPGLPAEALIDPPDAGALRRYRRLFVGLVLVWLGGEVAARAGLCSSPTWVVLTNIGRESYFTLALGGVFFLYYWSRPPAA